MDLFSLLQLENALERARRGFKTNCSFQHAPESISWLDFFWSAPFTDYLRVALPNGPRIADAFTGVGPGRLFLFCGDEAVGVVGSLLWHWRNSSLTLVSNRFLRGPSWSPVSSRFGRGGNLPLI